MRQRLAKNAVVVGGGIGGLACAAALAKRGVAVTLIEQSPEHREVGAGIQISPNGLAVLRGLGLEASLMRAGAVRADAVVLEDYKAGRKVAQLDLTRAKDQGYLFVHRADLIGLLARAARHGNVSFEMGRRATEIIPGEVPEVHMADGGVMRSELIVCADGIHSTGRPAVWSGPSPAFTGQVAWRAVVPAQSNDRRVHVTMGPGRHIVRYPLRDGTLTNIVAVQERSEWAEEGWTHADDPANLRKAFEAFGGPVAEALDAVRDVSLWGLFRHPVADTWERQGVVLMGDAAHPTLPFLAQGANMALEDAWVLAACAVSKGDMSAYPAARQQRVRRVIDASTGNAAKFHMRPGLTRTLAHTALSLGSRLAPGLMLGRYNWLYRHDVTRTYPL